MASTEQDIRIQIEKAPDKSVFFTEDFRGFGTSEAIKTTLHRLVKRGTIKSMARGIYAKPKESKLLGETLPGIDDVVDAIAKRDRARLLPTGILALHALGLSTQIPMKMVYLTDGTPRKIHIGKHTITFKSTSSKMLAMKGAVSQLAVLALKSIGNGYVRPAEEERIISLLRQESRKDLKHDINLAPQWIAEIMAKAL